MDDADLRRLLEHIDAMPIAPIAAPPMSAFAFAQVPQHTYYPPPPQQQPHPQPAPIPITSMPPYMQFDPLRGGTGLVGVDGTFSSHQLARHDGADFNVYLPPADLTGPLSSWPSWS